ncbi:hypothetical protein FA13DRAFT_1734670 [Coprinellus micaceus]|uniref:HMG box domain-containing protein n=1 Tax=Coprinellus micaceus TaxID=71717 RepID=A0A4Y7T5U3_COPMI|nr:hypothetical protein FA13DRAFT_1734670 [Coprinellus micaceus]
MGDNLSGGWTLPGTVPSSIDPLNAPQAGPNCVEYPVKRRAETSGGEPKANGSGNNTSPTPELNDTQKMLLFKTSVVLLLDTDKETFVVVDNEPPKLLGERANGTKSPAPSPSKQPLLNGQPAACSTHAAPTVVTLPSTSDTSPASSQSGPTVRPFAPKPLEFKVLEQPSLSLISVWWRYTDDKIDLLGSIDPMALAMVYAHQPTRPPNGSMLFRSEYTQAHPGSDISGRFGRAWKSLSESGKAVYNAQATRSALEHSMHYPGYIYSQLGEKRRTTMRGALHKAKEFLEEQRNSMSRELFHDLELVYDTAYVKLKKSNASKGASDRRKAAKKEEEINRAAGYTETVNSKSNATSSLALIANDYAAEGSGSADGGANGVPTHLFNASTQTVEDRGVSVADTGRKRKRSAKEAEFTRRSKVVKVAAVPNAPTALESSMTSTKVGLAPHLTKVGPDYPFTFKHSGYSNGAAQVPSSSVGANASWAPQPPLASMPSSDWESSFPATLYAPKPIHGFPGFGYSGSSDGSIPSNTPQSFATTPSTSYLPTPDILSHHPPPAVNVDPRLAHKAPIHYSPAHDAFDIELRQTAPLRNDQEGIALPLHAGGRTGTQGLLELLHSPDIPDAFNELELYISHGEATPATTQYRTNEGATYGYHGQDYSSRWDEGAAYSQDTQAYLYPNTEVGFHR